MADTGTRAQILLVVGLLLAVLFVALALVVNSAIYAENLSTREVSDEGSTALSDHRAVHSELSAMVDHTNARMKTTTYSDVMDAFEANLGEYWRTSVENRAETGRFVDLGIQGHSEAVRFRQTNESRDFTAANGDWDYTLSEGVPEQGHFTMNLQADSLYEATLDTTLSLLADSAFGVEFHLHDYEEEGDGVWRIYYFQGAATDNIHAIVERPDETFENKPDDAVLSGYLDQSCKVQSETVSVRLSQATYGGVACDEFEFYDDIGTHDLRYVNTRTELLDEELTGDEARARGSYDVMLGPSNYNEDAFEAVGEGQPFYQTAIYAVSYEYRFESKEAELITDVRTVRPTATDSGGIISQQPQVEFDAEDVSSEEDPAFEIDWIATDPDRNLERVELVMASVEGTDDEEIVDSETVSVSGGHAEGTTTLSDSTLLGGLGEKYRLYVTAVDEDGRATTESGEYTAES